MIRGARLPRRMTRGARGESARSICVWRVEFEIRVLGEIFRSALALTSYDFFCCDWADFFGLPSEIYFIFNFKIWRH